MIFDTGTSVLGRLKYWKESASPNWDGEVYQAVFKNDLIDTQGRYVELQRPIDRLGTLEMLSAYSMALKDEQSDYLRDQADLPRRQEANRAAQQQRIHAKPSELLLELSPPALRFEYARLDAEVTKSMRLKEKPRKQFHREPSDAELGVASARGWKLK